MAKFLIADDHPLFRDALIAAVHTHFEDLRVVESDSLESTLSQIEAHEDIDLCLLDLHMPGSGGLYGLIRLVEDFPKVPVVVISASDGANVVSQVMRFGARAFVPKSSSSREISLAIKHALTGGYWLPDGIPESALSASEEDVSVADKVATLTPKQHSVLQLLQAGLLNKQIAGELHITEATVKAHIGAIFRKLNVNTRTQAVLLAEKLQLSPE